MGPALVGPSPQDPLPVLPSCPSTHCARGLPSACWGSEAPGLDTPSENVRGVGAAREGEGPASDRTSAALQGGAVCPTGTAPSQRAQG